MVNNEKLVRNNILPPVWPKQLTSPNDLITSRRDNLRLASLKLIKSPFASKIVLQAVGTWAFLLARLCNKTHTYNAEIIHEELLKNEQNNTSDQENIRRTSSIINSPLVTFSNHISCIDDPVLWGSILPLSYYFRKHEYVRWSAAAREICFSKRWHSILFALGKTFPIDRGAGINQPAMEFALGLLRHNQWLHFFPEGRVMRDANNQPITNIDRGYNFKWGLSKLIIDYLKHGDNNNANKGKQIRLLPFYHVGLDEILPVGRPYIPRTGKKITVYFRPKTIYMNKDKLESILKEPVKLTKVINRLNSLDDKCLDRIKLTRYLESELEHLKSLALSHTRQLIN